MSAIYAALRALERLAERLKREADAIRRDLDKVQSERSGGRS